MAEVVQPPRRRWPWLVVVICVVAATVGFGPRLAGSALGTSPWPFDVHTVGIACRDNTDWVCGFIRVPLDRTKPSAGSVTVRFRILPRRLTARASAGTIVVVNGGPGASSMQQAKWARHAFAGLLADHDLLLVDNRGTGESDAIDCPKAQDDLVPAAIAQCRKILGTRAGDYGTVAAVDDLEAVLAVVHAGDVDLYGESYGTFFAQVFALRYPTHLARLVLDGALPLNVDHWALDSVSAGLADLRATCAADPTCHAAGDPLTPLAKVLARLRVGITPGYIGRRVYEVGTQLANAGRAGTAYRELPAALRAYLANDPVPLRRLMSEARDGAFGDGPPADVDSKGLYLANYCADQPPPFDLHAPIDEQRRQLDDSYKTAATILGNAAAPFKADETFRDESVCLGWPAPTAVIPMNLARDFPNVPTLVLEGGLDTVTPPAVARSVSREFPDSRFVEVPFVPHVAAVSDETGCVASIAATFLGSARIDTGCATRLVPPPQVDAFPTTFADEPPIVPIDKHGADGLSVNDLRTAGVARDAVADVFWRWIRLEMFSGHGLRGGTFTVTPSDTGGGYDLSLAGIRWTKDSTVSGDITTNPVQHSFSGFVTITTPAGTSALDIRSSNALGPSTVETISGKVDGNNIDMKVDAKLGL